MEILFLNETNKGVEDFKPTIRTSIKKTLELENLGSDFEISFVFTDDEKIRELNKKYRGEDSSTDVLSFPLDDDYMLGDIIVSLERAGDQAKEYGNSLEREISYLTVHSMLHLLGYDHIEEEDRLEMRAREKIIMKELGIFKGDINEK
mgnify:FL=1